MLESDKPEKPEEKPEEKPLRKNIIKRKKARERKRWAGIGKSSKKEYDARRPILTSWKMLNIKVGTELNCKLSDKWKLKTESEYTMECTLHCSGKERGRFGAIINAEKYIRKVIKKEVKRPQGWDIFKLEKSFKGKAETVHQRYSRMISAG